LEKEGRRRALVMEIKASGMTKASETMRDSGVTKASAMSKDLAEAGKVTAKDTEGRKERTSSEVNQEQARVRRENKASAMSKDLGERKASETMKDSGVMKASAKTKDLAENKASAMSKDLAGLLNPSSAVASIDSCRHDLISCLYAPIVFKCEFLA
jgi:uncharacterized protein (DUF2252 family)